MGQPGTACLVKAVALILLLVLITAPAPIHGGTKEDMYNLHNELFKTREYKKQVRPIADDSNSLFVYMGFYLLSLVDVNEKDQTLVSNARLVMSWSDYLLSWDRESYGNISSILVRQEDVWLPDVQVANSVIIQRQLGYDELPVRLIASGDIIWSPTAVLTTSCDIDVTYYPFDTQRCYIIFETSMSANTEVDVNIDQSEPISLEDYSEDGQWEIVDTNSENLSDEDFKTKIRFSLVLKRRRAYYVVNIVMPVVFLSLTSTLVFALPADAGEKMSMGITVLLAYAVYLTIVSDHLPNTSVQTSILAVYLTTLLGITALSIVVSVFILKLHHRPADTKVGKRTRKVVLFLRKITFSLSKADKQFAKNTVSPDKGTFRSENFSPYHATPDYTSPSRATNPTPELRHMEGDIKYDDDNDTGIDTSRIISAIPVDMASRMSSPPVYHAPMTWQYVAQTADLFLFLVFTSLAVMITVCMMAVLTLGADDTAPKLSKDV